MILLISILAGISISAIGLNICVITAEIEKYKSIIEKKKKKPNKIVLFTKSRLIGTKFLISKALIDLNINHDKFLCHNK